MLLLSIAVGLIGCAGSLKIETVEDIREACENNTPEDLELSVTFTALNEGCPFGEGDNLEASGARSSRNPTLIGADGGCGHPPSAIGRPLTTIEAARQVVPLPAAQCIRCALQSAPGLLRIVVVERRIGGEHVRHVSLAARFHPVFVPPALRMDRP